VRREVVEDDVNFLLRWATGNHLWEKVYELHAGVTLGGLALDPSRLHV
jgi:hypothetical protein